MNLLELFSFFFLRLLFLLLFLLSLTNRKKHTMSTSFQYSGKGFYNYTTDSKGRLKKAGLNPEIASRVKDYQERDLKLGKQEILDRLLCRFVNEAVFCLQDGILENPADGDIGAVFGFGFLPYTGGPFRMIDAIGADKYAGMMSGFADKYGPQFEPCDLLKDMAKNNKKFHK
jgi:enoyl-CoA hydratase / long-chain 3-hydroxyacyl-CoA dehydrogenase